VAVHQELEVHEDSAPRYRAIMREKQKTKKKTKSVGHEQETFDSVKGVR
jgi:hypothetical protein